MKKIIYQDLANAKTLFSLLFLLCLKINKMFVCHLYARRLGVDEAMIEILRDFSKEKV